MATNFYRTKDPRTGQDVMKEVGTDRYIGPTEFGQGAGFSEARPTNARPTTPTTNTTSKLGAYKSNQKFLDLVKQAIQKKQGMNKDIQSSRYYWRTQQRDPMTFTNESLQLATPAQQQSLREKRYATAGAHLQGLTEEEKYRGGRLDDVLAELETTRKGEADAVNNDEISEGRRLDQLLKKKSLGSNPTISDIEGSYISDDGNRVGNKTGGTLSWRNNNSGNLKYSDWQKEYGAIKDPNSAFAVFPDEKSARSAYKALLTSPTGIYSGLTSDEAMLKWSSDYSGDPRAYDYQKLVTLGAPAVSKDLSKFTDDEWNKLFEAQRKAEGWTVGTTLDSTTLQHDTWTEAATRALALKTGISSTELWGKYTDEELDAKALEAGTDLIAEMIGGLKANEILSTSIKDKTALEYILRLKYELDATDAEIEEFMKEMGMPTTKGKDSNGDPIKVLDLLEDIINPI